VPDRSAATPGAAALVTAALATVALSAAAAGATTGPSTPPATPAPARYQVRLARIDPPLFQVSALLPVDGDRISMEETRPGDLPQLLEHGWPALVANLQVTDAAGRPVEAAFSGDSSWTLPRRYSETVRLEYTVDLALLKENGWPAPREAACVDDGTIVLVGRSLFMKDAGRRGTTVRFDLPPGWSAHAPWPEVRGHAAGHDAASQRGPEQPGQEAPPATSRFEVGAPEDLTANLVVLTRDRLEALRVAGFELTVVPMGYWRPIEPAVRAMLRAHLRRFVTLMRFDDRDRYLVVLLPAPDRGAESYRQSFAATVPDAPTLANRPYWGNLLGHELFHYWNGWRLRGGTYAPSQWFQEGFTEYVANVSMAASGVVPDDWFLGKLSGHVDNVRRLATPLEMPGDRKGPPLYSAGALVAFSWDVMIRDATGGRKNLGDFLRALWRRCDGGALPYDWGDIAAALAATAPGDWQAFHAAHVAGTAPLPPPGVLARAGLRLSDDGGDAAHLAIDPSAEAMDRRRLRDIARGH